MAAFAGVALAALQAAAFPEVYSQTIEWGECNDTFGLSDAETDSLSAIDVPVESYTCGTIEAPMDWKDPANTKTIQLAAVRIPSTGKDAPIGTLLTNPGGPGVSGLNFTYALPASLSFTEILNHYDVVGFDPRGIGRSTPAGCEKKSSIAELNLALCAKDSPIALTMGTSQVARDMELLRSLMGDDSLHYLGYSYGTVLGATYSTLFPERVGRMILDSASASNWASPIGNFTQALALAREADAMLDQCGDLYKVLACPLSDQGDPLTAVALLAAEPRIATVGSEVTGEAFYGYVVSALYDGAAGREHALETIASALANDQSSIDGIALEQAGGGSNVDLDGSIVSCHSFPADPKLPDLSTLFVRSVCPQRWEGPRSLTNP